MRIAVATSENAASLSKDDSVLHRAFASRGVASDAVVWRRGDVDWGGYQMVLIRSTWDYQWHLADFERWLERVDARAPVANRVDIVRWNLDKRYLCELEAGGVAIVPTDVVDPGGLHRAVAARLAQWPGGVVIKPTVGAGACAISVVRSAAGVAALPLHGPAGESRPWLVQPFMDEITSDGELSIIAIDGRVTHAVRKRPAAGDFRVQREHGGSVVIDDAPPAALELAQAALAACPAPPLAARVDMIQTGGDWRVMELEAIEPELFLALAPAAADALVSAVLDRLAAG